MKSQITVRELIQQINEGVYVFDYKSTKVSLELDSLVAFCILTNDLSSFNYCFYLSNKCLGEHNNRFTALLQLATDPNCPENIRNKANEIVINIIPF